MALHLILYWLIFLNCQSQLWLFFQDILIWIKKLLWRVVIIEICSNNHVYFFIQMRSNYLSWRGKMEHLLWSTINPLAQRTWRTWFSCTHSFIKLTPTQEIPSDRLTVLPLALLQREAKGALRIGVELFGLMERMGNLPIN